uniref:Uncharacterized protein n=1 Tax=Ciona savignyi TaxID=51511 RepID=H2ZAC0_CIOSA
MMDVCLTKCRDYMERMDTERQLNEIRAELWSLRNELNIYKAVIIITTILVPILIAVVIGFIFYIKNHMQKNYQHRFRQMQQSKCVPDGDNIDEAQPFEATLNNPQNGGF